MRGNLFKNLYSPYLDSFVIIKPSNKQEELLTKIDALEFSLIDLNLYLDIYPDDKYIINLFNEYKNQLSITKNEYEKIFGPLNINSQETDTYPWSWINMPWPWN